MAMDKAITLKLFTIILTTLCYCSYTSVASPYDPYTSSNSSTHVHHRSNITWWCSKTPHPEQCNFFMSHSRHRFAPTHRSDFRKMMVQLAMERAVNAQREVLEYGPSCQNGTQKAAWSDCLKLYDNTIFHLNRTLVGLNKTCTTFDAQTWLSTALTNIHTCSQGSEDLNLTSFMIPMVTNNVSHLISNSLAVNGVLLAVENRTYFPSWLWERERRLLTSTTLTAKASVVVAKDGSGHYRTVQAAINAAAKRRGTGRFIIHVKRGVYRENIEVANHNDNVILVGDGIKYTIITSNRNVKAGYTTYSSATAGIDGLHFMARGITFSNTAGPLRGQAVALRSASDLSVFYQCAFQGYQDTLMVHSQRQFYRNCYIYGTIDFIFGNAAVVFQNCLIYARRPLKGQANMITAQGRNDPFQNTGIAIHNSMVLAAPDLKPVVRAVKTYLGRPWQQYSRTVFMKTYMDTLVSPLGWSPWGKSTFAQDTLYYGEYKNKGPGSSTRYRVKWKGFKVITSSAEASKFTVGTLIAGRSWLPATGVPYTSGL